MATNSNCRDTFVVMPMFNRRDLDHSKLSLPHMYRNGPADAQFEDHIFGLSAKIKFTDIASH